jgi:hypothetical protein
MVVPACQVERQKNTDEDAEAVSIIDTHAACKAQFKDAPKQPWLV